MESSGLRSNLFGRPRQRYFLNTKIENDSVYIVDDLLSDISKPIIESVKFVSQNPVNNEVTVLVKAYDLDSELRSVKVSLSGYLDLINSSAFTPHGSDGYFVTIPMPSWTRNDLYDIFSVSVSDAAGNRTTLMQERGNKNVFAGSTVKVASMYLLGNSKEDTEGPSLSRVDSEINEDASSISISIYAQDSSGLSSAELIVMDGARSLILFPQLIRLDSSSAHFEVEIPEDFHGTLKLTEIVLKDSEENTSHFKADDSSEFYIGTKHRAPILMTPLLSNSDTSPHGSL